jgi:HSP20 family protein
MAGWQSFQQSPLHQSMWNLGAAQAQMEAIAAALMPLGIAPSGRTQVPSVEIEDIGENLMITAFLPGVDPKAVQVRASRQSITFAGQRQSGYRNPLMQGLGVNYFQQTVPLPAPVSDRQMQVAYRGGAIVVTLPKQRGWAQRLAASWGHTRQWLGHTFQRWAQQLLEDR